MTDGHPQTETCPMVIAIRAEHAASTFQQLLEKISSRYRPESTTDVEQLRSDAATFSPDQIEQIVDEIFRVDKCLGGCSHKAEWLGPIISAIPSRAQELADRVDHLKRHTKGELPEKVVFLRSLFPSLGAASPQTYAPFVQLACSEHYGKIITDFEITEALPSMSTAQCDQICRKALSLDSAPCEYACTEKIFYRLPYFSQTVRDAVWEKISATHQAILNSEHPDQVRFLPMAVAPTARCAGIFDQLPAEERVKWMNAPWTELI